MMPGDEIEIEDDEYVHATATIHDSPMRVAASANTLDGDEMKLGLGDTWPAGEKGRGWCATIEAVGVNEDGQKVKSSVFIDKDVAQKLINHLGNFSDWDLEVENDD